MRFECISVEDNIRVLVIGTFYDKVSKLEEIKKIRKEADIIILFGNNDHENINIIRKFVEEVNAYYILGNRDLIFATKQYDQNINVCEWIKKQYVGIRLEFNNNSNFVITYGGLKNYQKIEELNHEFEICFMNDENIHFQYRGNSGYLISHNPCQEQIKKYRYSVSLGLTKDCNHISVQEVNKSGLGQTFYV
jgi:hypothetical protein